MPEPQVVLQSPRDRMLSRRDSVRHRWVVALAGLPCVVALMWSAAPVDAASLPSRPHTGTVTRLTALPGPGRTPGLVTLVARETSADGTHPAGWVQFEADGTDIGGPVSLGTDGVATTTAAFSAGASAALSAAFTPTSTAYVASAATDTATVNGGTGAGSISISLTVPPVGSLAVTMMPGTITLAVHGTNPPIATGTLPAITVADYRSSLPGWSITGQASSLTAAGQPVSRTRLGWTPAGTVTGGAKLGPPVAPSNPGFGSTGAVLAVAAPGSGLGTDTLSAELMLAVPAGAQGGPYAGTLTITFMEAGPQPTSLGTTFPSAG
jgi:hypothetical protein